MILPLLKEIGKQKFPAIDEKFAPAAAASTMFDPIRLKWLQTALNVLGANPPLDVDGEYGPMTKDAVLQFQKAHDLVADGWAGDTTHAALQLALAKKPKSAAVSWCSLSEPCERRSECHPLHHRRRSCHLVPAV